MSYEIQVRAARWAGYQSLGEDGDQSLEALIYNRLSAYVNTLHGHHVKGLNQLAEPQFERALYRLGMELAGGRQLVAAEILGVHRNTLRKKLEKLKISALHGRES